jgi:Fe2+ transport system protein B
MILGGLLVWFVTGDPAGNWSGPEFIPVLLGLGCSVCGGFVAATLAKENRALNALMSSSVCVTLGLYYLIAGLVPLSLLFQLALIAITPVCYLVGASLRLRAIASE